MALYRPFAMTLNNTNNGKGLVECNEEIINCSCSYLLPNSCPLSVPGHVHGKETRNKFWLTEEQLRDRNVLTYFHGFLSLSA